jgi:Flp pilus assembly protein TadG
MRRDRGSMAVEFVIAAPALVLLLLLISAAGQWLNLTGDVSAAARDSVRAASLARDYDDANTDASAAAAADLNGVCADLQTPPPQLFEDGGPVGPDDFPVAQDIQVTVSCVADLKVFSAIGFPVSETFTDTAAAPLDPFEDRGTPQ